MKTLKISFEGAKPDDEEFIKQSNDKNVSFALEIIPTLLNRVIINLGYLMLKEIEAEINCMYPVIILISTDT